MLYITLKKYEDKNNFLKKVYYLIKNNKLKIMNYMEHQLIILNDLNKRTIKRLKRFFKLNCTNIVCISDELRNNNDFIQLLNEEDIYYFNGNWLFKYLVSKIVEYIVLNKKDKMENQKVSILTNDINADIMNTIYNLALKVREINIITKHKNKFLKIEKKLYEENGIILNITNHYEKSLRKSDFVINYDFSEEDINKYYVYPKASFINVNNKIKIHTKSFNGINVYSFHIGLPDKYNYDEWINDFDKSILYESFIYKNTLPENIRKEIENDKIAINLLSGQNGIIRKSEYLKLNKKI